MIKFLDKNSNSIQAAAAAISAFAVIAGGVFWLFSSNPSDEEQVASIVTAVFLQIEERKEAEASDLQSQIETSDEPEQPQLQSDVMAAEQTAEDARRIAEMVRVPRDTNADPDLIKPTELPQLAIENDVLDLLNGSDLSSITKEALLTALVAAQENPALLTAVEQQIRVRTLGD